MDDRFGALKLFRCVYSGELKKGDTILEYRSP